MDELTKLLQLAGKKNITESSDPYIDSYDARYDVPEEEDEDPLAWHHKWAGKIAKAYFSQGYQSLGPGEKPNSFYMQLDDGREYYVEFEEHPNGDTMTKISQR